MDGGILASLGTSDRPTDCMGRVIDRSLIESVSRPSPKASEGRRSYSGGMAWRSLKFLIGVIKDTALHKSTIYVQSRREL